MTSGLITSWQIAGETIETVTDFIFLVSRITADLYYSHEIKKCLLLGRKAVTNLDSVLKSKHYFANKIPSSQAVVIPYVRMWELDCKEVWAPKNWCFWTVVLEKTLESPLDSKEIKPVNPEGNQLWIIHWKDWCWSWSSSTLATWCEELIHWQRPWCWERFKAGGEEDDKVRDGWMASPTWWTWVWASSKRWWRTESLACCTPWGHKESYMTKGLNSIFALPLIFFFLSPYMQISVQFSRSVMSDSLRPHELQHARPPCPSPTPGVHSNSHPSSRWCHPAISSSVVPFSSCPQSLPASVFSNESTLWMRWPKYWSFSFSIIPSKEHPGLISFRMDWLDLLAVQGTLYAVHIYADIHVCVYICVYICIYVCVYIHMCTYTHTHTYIYIHTLLMLLSRFSRVRLCATP